MKRAERRATPPRSWYILWSAMFCFSAANALLAHSISSSSLGFIASIVLAALAALQMCGKAKLLDRKEASLAATMLVVFASSQLVMWVRSLAPISPYRGFDFSAYYFAAKALVETPGRSLYYLPFYPDGRMDLHAAASVSSAWQAAALRYKVPFPAPYIYPPFFAVLMKPFSYLSFTSAFLVWEGISVLLLAGSIWLTIDMAAGRMNRSLMLILGVGVFSYFPLRDGLIMGQISILILFLTTVAVWFLWRKLTVFSALSLAIATMIKLTPVLALPILLFHRRWKWLAAYLIGLSVILLVSVQQAGWGIHRQFWYTVLPGISCGSPICQNSSIPAYVQELFLGYVPDWINRPRALPLFACTTSRFVAFVVYILMLFRFYVRRRDEKIERDLVVMALLGVVISPIGWWHHFTIAILPFLFFWYRMPTKRDPIFLILFVVVGTNLVGFAPLLTTNHAIQLILAAIVPGLTVVWCYRCLRPGSEISNDRFLSEAQS